MAEINADSQALAAFEQLGNAAFGSILLPLLTGHGSVASLAQACKPLRQLCQQCCTELDLPSSSAQEDSSLVPLPIRFPHCTSVRYTMGCGREPALGFTRALAVLAK